MRIIKIRKNTILLACAPKSGSTYIKKGIVSCTELTPLKLALREGWHELDRDKLVEVLDTGVITQLHMPLSLYSVDLINKYDLKCIVLTRNIYDTTISILDHLNKKSVKQGTLEKFGFNHSHVIFPKIFFELSSAEKINLIIKIALPYYINFGMSWYLYQEKLNRKPYWITYDDFFEEEQKSFDKILNHFNIIKTKKFDVNIKNPKTRFNVGTSGRGKKLLNNKQIKLIDDLIHPYKKFLKGVFF